MYYIDCKDGEANWKWLLYDVENGCGSLSGVLYNGGVVTYE